MVAFNFKVQQNLTKKRHV